MADLLIRVYNQTHKKGCFVLQYETKPEGKLYNSTPFEVNISQNLKFITVTGKYFGFNDLQLRLIEIPPIIVQ